MFAVISESRNSNGGRFGLEIFAHNCPHNFLIQLCLIHLSPEALLCVLPLFVGSHCCVLGITEKIPMVIP